MQNKTYSIENIYPKPEVALLFVVKGYLTPRIGTIVHERLFYPQEAI